MIAVFNVSSSETSEFISLPEFKGLDRAADKKYVIRQQSTGRVFGPATKASDATVISLTLPVAGWEFLSAVPVHQAEGFDVGVLGLVGQFSGAAAVLAWAAVKDGAVTMVTVRIKALGVLGSYPPSPPCVLLRVSDGWNRFLYFGPGIEGD